MKTSCISSFKCTVLFVIVLGFMVFIPPSFAGRRCQSPDYNPVIFVHGGAGSASQFESQAMRFMSNGYSRKYVYALEYDSSWTVNTMGDVLAKLDVLIDEVLNATGKAQVNLVGHSMGTYVSQTYLNSSAVRASLVSNYVNVDGMSATTPPGGVSTLALWAGIGMSDATGWIEGAKNVTLDNQTHVESTTSAESFFEIYTFFTGMEPKTTSIIPSRKRRIEISGRACYFPENTGVSGAILQIYKVRGKNGKRIEKHPRRVYTIDDDGNFGPFSAHVGDQFEFVLVRDGQKHHFYKEPFVRNDYFVRLNTSMVGEGIGAMMDKSPDQANVIVSRDKEFWGELPLENDILAINGLNVITAYNCEFANRTNALIVFDAFSDTVSSLDAPVDPPMDYFHALPFMTGVDVFLPSSGTIRMALIPRGGRGLMQSMNVPAWPSDGHRISVQFNDYVQ